MVAKEPIFIGLKGGRTKTVHLGKAESDRYNAAVVAIHRRNAIQQLETQIIKIEDLIEKDKTLPSTEDFKKFA